MPATFLSCSFRFTVAALTSLTLVIASGALAQAAPLYPFPQHAAYASGTIKPNHRSQIQLDHFRAFGRATGDPVWNQVIAAAQNSIDYLQLKYSPKTGLLPDFIRPISSTNHNSRPAGSNFLESAFDGSYYYNAARDPWRLGTDAVLNNDAKSLTEVRKISAWIQTAAASNPANIRAGYTLGGSRLSGSNYFTTVFVAPFGVAAMTQSSQQSWLNAIYSAVYNVHEGYFEDSVNLLCLLVMSGNYWDPTTISGS